MKKDSIRIGTKVQVTDWGYQYSTYITYLKDIKDEVDADIIIRYAFGDDTHYRGKTCTDSDVYIVLYADKEHELALIALPGVYTPVYLIDCDALKPAPVDLTKSQIEELLGYPINIIEESTDGS